MSQSGASLLLVFLLFGLAVVLLLSPPPGFEEAMLHRLVLPFVLVATAFGILENLRTRRHMSQLIGALRAQAGQRGAPADPKVVREAVEILIASLKSPDEKVRNTAGQELRKLTGQELGTDFDLWTRWWASNRSDFGKRPS